MKNLYKYVFIFIFTSSICNQTQAHDKSALITNIFKKNLTVLSSLYIFSHYLIQEDFFVEVKYPHAYQWYKDMSEKYPMAHLEDKLFLQKIWGMPTWLTTHSSSISNIYFPQESLKMIDALYGIKLQNQKLSAKDELYLAGQEFILLHEAGHIEKNHIINRFLINGTASIITALYSNDDNDFLAKIIPIRLIGIFFILSRYQERAADNFAYSLADEQALLGGIAFFENEDINPFVNLDAPRSPYIDSQYTIGYLIQSMVASIEIPAYYLDKGIKKIFNISEVTRWLYEVYNYSHPGNSERAATIKEELARRLLKINIEEDNVKEQFIE